MGRKLNVFPGRKSDEQQAYTFTDFFAMSLSTCFTAIAQNRLNVQIFHNSSFMLTFMQNSARVLGLKVYEVTIIYTVVGVAGM